MRLTIDSFAWIELIRGTPLGDRSREIIEAAASNFTPAIVLAEVVHICLRDGLDPGIVAKELRAMGEASEIVPIDEGLALAGSKTTTELRKRSGRRGLAVPGLADGLVLATARELGSRLLTGDPHFQDLRETLWLG